MHPFVCQMNDSKQWGEDALSIANMEMVYFSLAMWRMKRRRASKKPSARPSARRRSRGRRRRRDAANRGRRIYPKYPLPLDPGSQSSFSQHGSQEIPHGPRVTFILTLPFDKAKNGTKGYKSPVIEFLHWTAPKREPILRHTKDWTGPMFVQKLEKKLQTSKPCSCSLQEMCQIRSAATVTTKMGHLASASSRHQAQS